MLSQDRHRLWYRADNNDKNAVIMRTMLSERPEQLLTAILLCNNLVNVTCAIAATSLAAKWFGADDSLLLPTTLLVTFIILVFGEITPKVVGVRHAERIALFCARPLYGLLWVLSPFIRVAGFFSSCLLFALGMNRHTVLHTAMNIKELRAAVRAASAGGGRDIHYNMLERTLFFNETPVEKIMTPRREIRGLDLRQSAADIKTRIVETNFSKLPLFDGNLDEIKGVVDTLQALKGAGDAPPSADMLTALAEPAYFVPAAAGAMQQLQRMRHNKRRMAFVLDGTGQIVGLLTFTDFAAAIIGDEKPPESTHRIGDALDVPADITLIQLQQLEPRLSPPPDIAATTLNGLILETLGDLPDKPVCLRRDEWRIEITVLSDKSVLRARLHLPPPKENGDD